MSHSADFYFPPNSAIWRINREQILLLTGARVLLMQIAHPLVAEAVYDHSYLFEKPVKRLLRTLELTLALVYGTRDEVLNAARSINQSHHRATGTVSQTIGNYQQGTRYAAQTPDLLLWVYATLVEGALTGYERLVAPLPDADKQAFFNDSRQLAALLGIPRAVLPASLDALYHYMDDMLCNGEIVVSPKARTIAPYVMAQTSPLLKILAFPPSRLTIGLLSPTLRTQYGFAFANWEAAALDTFSRTARHVVPRLPPTLRYVSQYRRARRRLRSL